MRKQLLCLALITSVVALASPATEGTLSGRITDPAGAVVADVPVRIQHWEANELQRLVVTEDSLLKTDMHGRYSLNLNPGLYDVFITFPSFSPVARRVKVEAGRVTDFSPKLKFDKTTRFVE